MSFRSVVMSLEAGVMNLLSIAGAYGIVAYVADGGWAGRLVGIAAPTPSRPVHPVLMFAVLFGLSMAYEVFLVSRVRDAYLAGRDTADAIAEGLVRTARVITAAR